MNKKSINRKINSGFTIVEVIIACAIISVTVFSLMTVAQKGISLSDRALRQSQANVLLEEGAEALKSIRDNSWETIDTLNLDTDYYLFFDLTAEAWTLNSSIESQSGFIPSYPIDSIFTRTVTISEVNRDANGDISSLGNLDERTKKVTINVTWTKSGETISKDLNFYLADIFN